MAIFTPATRHKLKLRMTIDGPSGSGKTYTALRFAQALAARGNGRIAVIDTEHGAASKYLGLAPDGEAWKFDVCEMSLFSPEAYAGAIREAGTQGYDVLVIDSLSHAWEGKGGALEQVDSKSGNKFLAWKDVTPKHRAMFEAILSCPCHVIATMRTKMDYVIEQDERGKAVPRKVGMAPVQRAGSEYEFDIVCDMDLQHEIAVVKTRCPSIDGLKVLCPGTDFVVPIIRWLDDDEKTKTEIAAPFIPPPPPAAFVQYDNDYCTVLQQNDIKSLAREMEMPPEALSAAIRKRGAERLAGLTYKQAEEVRNNLWAIWSNKTSPF